MLTMKCKPVLSEKYVTLFKTRWCKICNVANSFIFHVEKKKKKTLKSLSEKAGAEDSATTNRIGS